MSCTQAFWFPGLFGSTYKEFHTACFGGLYMGQEFGLEVQKLGNYRPSCSGETVKHTSD